MMKVFTTILLFCSSANATTYYVSATGSNGNNGITTGTPFLTITHALSLAVAGDNILLKKGDVFNEAVRLITSGTIGNVITIGAYGTGVKPEITALQTLSMNSLGNNLYSATATNSVLTLNTILVNGAIAAKGRTPNATYLLTTAPSSTTVINTGLTGTPNYSGAELVLSDVTYVWDVARIASQSTGVLTLAIPVTYTSAGNDRYFIQNLASLCDVQNDFAFDSTTKLLTVYSTTAPTVKISTIDTLITVHKKDYITFDGLNITGANNVGIYRDTANHITVQNCTFNYIGGYNPSPVVRSGLGGAAIRSENADYSITQNDSILNSLNDAIFDTHSCDYHTIYNNYIKNTGMLAGMGAGSNSASLAIFVNGHSPQVANNRIDSVGFNGIHFIASDTAWIYKNYVTNYCTNKGDGGGIYTVSQGSEGSIIRSNIVLNGQSTGGNTAAGIYLDGDARYITVDSNTVKDGYLQAVLFHYPDHIEFHDNTIMSGIGACFWYAVGGAGNHFNITRNTFYQTDTVSAITNATIYLYYNSLFAGSVSDSNYLLRPLKEANQFRYGSANTSYSLAGWTASNTYEAHSHLTPSGITSAAGVLYINPTDHDSTIVFSGVRKDATGTSYLGSATIHSCQSKLLFSSLSSYIIRVAGRLFN